MRIVSRYIKPKSMAYLQKKSVGKNIGWLLLSLFLWLHAILQDTMTLYTGSITLLAFVIMARFNSKVFAFLTLISAVGVFYMPESWSYIALGVFSATLFIGVIMIVGGPKRTVSVGPHWIGGEY